MQPAGEGVLRPFSSAGKELQADFSVAGTWPDFEVTFESGDGRGRNSDYKPAVELVLARLGAIGGVLRATWISSPTVLAKVEQEGLDPHFVPKKFEFPLSLAGIDHGQLRRSIGSAGALINISVRSDGTKLSGNTTRRMTLALSFPEPELSAAELEFALAGRLAGVDAGPSLAMETDLSAIDAAISDWLSALQSGAAGGDRWWLATEAILVASRSSKRRAGAWDAELGVRPSGEPWTVQLNAPEGAADANGLTTMARSSDGRRFLIRQGWLRQNPDSDGEVRGERFRKLSGLSPVSVSGGTTPTPREWYVVADLDQPADGIRRQTGAFVHACARARRLSLAPQTLTSPGKDLTPVFVAPGDASLVRRTVASIEQHSSGYQVARLQDLRKELRGLKRLAGRRIFSDRSVSDKWAFHSGGRDELQFNVGLDIMGDGSPALRAGVAFSLEPSQSLPDWTVLVPRIARFNAFLRENPDAFPDLAMWNWLGDDRSPDRRPGPVEPEIVKANSFIFLGSRQPRETVDVHSCLKTFDQLLALYRHVQADLGSNAPSFGAPTSGIAVGAVAVAMLEELRLEGGVTAKKTGWVTATYAQRTLDIELRHNELQNRLKAKLEADGVGVVTLEAKLGQRAIDLVVQAGDDLWFYEVKTGTSVRHCLREAIGQLLEYALWPGATLPAKLIVVGEGAPTAASDAYLAALNERFPVSLHYKQFLLD